MGTGAERGWLRGLETALARRSETWTKGGTKERIFAWARLRPVNLRPEDYRPQRALLPPRRSRNLTPPAEFPLRVGAGHPGTCSPPRVPGGSADPAFRGSQWPAQLGGASPSSFSPLASF